MKRIALALLLCAFAGMASADPAQVDQKQPGQVWVIAMTLLGPPGVPMKDIPEFTTQSGCELYMFHIGEQVVSTFKLVCLPKEAD